MEMSIAPYLDMTGQRNLYLYKLRIHVEEQSFDYISIPTLGYEKRVS